MIGISPAPEAQREREAPTTFELSRASASRNLTRSSRRPLLIELVRADRLFHLLRSLAIDASVLELDPRKVALAGRRDRSLPPRFRVPVSLLDELVVDSGVVERLLNAPAGMARRFDPRSAAAVELDGHFSS